MQNSVSRHALVWQFMEFLYIQLERHSIEKCSSEIDRFIY
jgi:hypothetical protein